MPAARSLTTRPQIYVCRDGAPANRAASPEPRLRSREHRQLYGLGLERYSIESSFDTLGMSMPDQLLYVADLVQGSQRTVMVRVS